MKTVPLRPLSSRSCAAEHGQRGFALVIVLWVLAGLTVIAVVVASSARVSNESVKLLRDRVQAEVAFLSTSARVKVIAATGVPQRMSIDGLKGRLLLDGRNTAVAPGESVSIQDERGLLNFNRHSRDHMQSLLQRCGAKEPQTAELLDALADYVDEDNNKLLNGAEAFDYRLANLPEPRNSPLLSREEVWRVKGWAERRDQWKAVGCDDFVTTHNDGRFNSNTASAAMLQVTGITEDAAAAMVQARREGFEMSATQASISLKGDLFSGIGGGFSGSVLRITHQSASIDWILNYDLELTPTRDGGPWRMHEIRYRPRSGPPPDTLAELPPPDFELPESQRTTPNVLSNSPFAN